MKSDLIHLLFSTKLAIADELIHCMPEPLKSKFADFQRTVITAVHEATEEYLEKSAPEHDQKLDKGKLRTIPVE